MEPLGPRKIRGPALRKEYPGFGGIGKTKQHEIIDTLIKKSQVKEFKDLYDIYGEN